MRIITLMEDTKGTKGLVAEHGLCFYIETEKHKLLMDTGASELTWKNADELGIDISKVDTLVISHGHYDHTGGVLDFVQRCPDAQIYMQKDAGKNYYHGERYIGIDKNILCLSQLHLVNDKFIIDEELEIFCGISGRKHWPKSNEVLSEMINGKLQQDQFLHEQCLVIRNGDSNILISGCAHNGILNILEKYHNLYQEIPSQVLSGFHMMKKSEYTDAENQIIKDTAIELKRYPAVFYTGHCTGQPAFDIMKEIMGDQLRQIHVGSEILI